MPKSPEQKNLINEEVKTFKESLVEKTETETPEILRAPDKQLEKKFNEQDKEKLKSIRKEILELTQEKKEDDIEDKTSLLRRLRLARNFDFRPADLTAKDKDLISEMASNSESRLKKNYEPGYGVFPASDPKENFYEQIWTRDLGHAAGNYFVNKEPKAVADSFNTLFKYQREDGMLPLRIEKEYLLLKVFPGMRSLAKPIFNLIEKRIKGRNERPVYEGQDFSSAQDTVPTTLVAIGEFFINSPEGKDFVKKHFDQIKKAADFFRGKSDPEDNLIDVKKSNADWADSIIRGGKLGNINIWWARSLRMMEFMANSLGREEDAKNYKEEFRKVKNSIIEKLYNKEQGYFRAKEGENRMDTVASVFGSLYLLGPKEAAKVQETLKQRVKRASGLKNFDPPYPNKQIMLPLRIIGHGGYHNEYVWPWITCQNIQAKIKIALQHPEENIRSQYKKEAVTDLADMAKLFKEAGGAYEIFDPNTRKPPKERFYTPPKNIMGNLAAYQGAYLQLKELGWI